MCVCECVSVVCICVASLSPVRSFTHSSPFFSILFAFPSWSCQGSSFIALDVLVWSKRQTGSKRSSPRSRRQSQSDLKRITMYQQFVLGICFFDGISSIAYILVGVMAPVEAGFYQSFGNEQTCTAQGFLIQLGSTSMFYNVCLSIYFLLVIVFNWKEHDWKKWGRWIHATVLLIGIGLAVGSLPYINAQFGVCGILPPLTSSQWQVSLFYTGPVCVVLLILFVATTIICREVYTQQKRAVKWRMVNGEDRLDPPSDTIRRTPRSKPSKRSSLAKRVFWQSFWYVMAFFSTLPFVLVTFYIRFTTPQHYWLLVVTAVLAPLQGFMNAMIYFQRSRQSKVFQNICGCIGRKQADTTSVAPSGLSSSVPPRTNFKASSEFFARPNDRSGRSDSIGGMDSSRERRRGSEQHESAVQEHWLLNEAWDTEPRKRHRDFQKQSRGHGHGQHAVDELAEEGMDVLSDKGNLDDTNTMIQEVSASHSDAETSHFMA